MEVWSNPLVLGLLNQGLHYLLEKTFLAIFHLVFFKGVDAGLT